MARTKPGLPRTERLQSSQSDELQAIAELNKRQERSAGIARAMAQQRLLDEENLRQAGLADKARSIDFGEKPGRLNLPIGPTARLLSETESVEDVSRRRTSAEGLTPGAASDSAFTRFRKALGRGLGLPRTAEEIGQRLALGVSRIPEGIEAGLATEGGGANVGLAGVVGGLRGLGRAKARELAGRQTERALRVKEEAPGERLKLAAAKEETRKKIAKDKDSNRLIRLNAEIRARNKRNTDMINSLASRQGASLDSANLLQRRKLAAINVTDAFKRVSNLESLKAKDEDVTIQMLDDALQAAIEAEDVARNLGVPLPKKGTVKKGQSKFIGSDISPRIERDDPLGLGLTAKEKKALGL